MERSKAALGDRAAFLLELLSASYWSSIPGCRFTKEDDPWTPLTGDPDILEWAVHRSFTTHQCFRVLYGPPKQILVWSEYDGGHPDAHSMRLYQIEFINARSAELVYQIMSDLRRSCGTGVWVQDPEDREADEDFREWAGVAEDLGMHMDVDSGLADDLWNRRDDLSRQWLQEHEGQGLTREMLRRHDELLNELHGVAGAEDRASSGSAFTDTYEAFRDRANDALIWCHGPHDGFSHALYLDGRALRTSRKLIEAGWPPSHLHVPNSSKQDFAAIQTRLKQSGWAVNVYPLSSAEFLRHKGIESWAWHISRDRKLERERVLYLLEPGRHPSHWFTWITRTPPIALATCKACSVSSSRMVFWL